MGAASAIAVLCGNVRERDILRCQEKYLYSNLESGGDANVH